MKHSISIIIPAYNEEKNLHDTIKSTKQALEGLFTDYELLIFNDCSSDKTGLIADELAKNDTKIKVIHNPKNMGLGYNYLKGIKLATKDQVMWIPGDNVNTVEGIRNIMKNADKADIIIPCVGNSEMRPLFRRIISKIFVGLMNLIMNLNISYYNGTVLYKTKLVKNIKITTHSFAYQAEILSKLLKSGYNFFEVSDGNNLREKQYEGTTLFRPKNLAGIFKAIFTLFWDIRVKNRKKYNKKPIRIN